MPEIGVMLREARMRAHIDISEIETETKIRAKYLRALENEEWDLLPGPTFVKSFLRTYAEVLGLDAKLIVEEFKLRHERPSEFDLQPIRATNAGRERYKGPRPVVPRWAIGVLLAIALIVALYVLGTGGPSTGGNTPPPAPATNPAPVGSSSTPKTPTKPPAATPTPPRQKEVALRIIPTGLVNVCLVGDGRVLIKSRNLTAGQKTPVYRAHKFELTLGTNAVSLHVSGKTIKVPPVSAGIGYEMTTSGNKVLSPAKRPTCA
ncbi:MAG TPA: helix-turn-helix domain-containing protein [Solirubrobacteraceae bacterium]